jgi:hypothetical protein
MGEYARSARGIVTSSGAVMAINCPFEPQAVQLYNQTVYQAGNSRNNSVASSWWDFDMGQGAAIGEVLASSGLSSGSFSYLTTTNFTTGGISSFSAGIAFQFGNPVTIQASTKGSPTTSFQANGHGFTTGDVVIFDSLWEADYTSGMPQMTGMPFVVTRVDANNFTVTWDSSGSSYTNLTSGTAATVKLILFPYLYAPGVSFINSITLGSTTIITTTAPHNLSLGSEVAFRIPKLWGTVQLNSLNDPRRPGSPLYGYVMTVNSATSVTVKINSSYFTAYNSNIPIMYTSGLTHPQMLATGDINSGGNNYSGGNLYPSPVVNGSPTINGPAILGAFVNNTSSGFMIGTNLVGMSGDAIYWYAYLYDYSNS